MTPAYMYWHLKSNKGRKTNNVSILQILLKKQWFKMRETYRTSKEANKKRWLYRRKKKKGGGKPFTSMKLLITGLYSIKYVLANGGVTMT